MSKLDEDYDSKYEDDYGEAKRGGGGGKEAEYDDGDDPNAVVLPELVKKFAHFVVSKKFRQPVNGWIQKNCDDFRGADFAEEQRIEWTALYEDYIGVVERLLDEFCDKNRVDAEDVFREVQAVTHSGELDDEFLPGILHIADYEYFLKQMAFAADKKVLIEDARDQAAESKGDSDSITGVWKVDKKKTDFSTVDAWLSALRVPKTFVGVAKGSFFSNKEVLITQDRAGCTIIQESPFGMRKEQYDLDGATKLVRNLWNRTTPVTARETRRGEVVIAYEEPPQLPRGSQLRYRWGALDDGRSLSCVMEADVRGRGVVTQEIWYKRA